MYVPDEKDGAACSVVKLEEVGVDVGLGALCPHLQQQQLNDEQVFKDLKAKIL